MAIAPLGPSQPSPFSSPLKEALTMASVAATIHRQERRAKKNQKKADTKKKTGASVDNLPPATNDQGTTNATIFVRTTWPERARTSRPVPTRDAQRATASRLSSVGGRYVRRQSSRTRSGKRLKPCDSVVLIPSHRRCGRDSSEKLYTTPPPHKACDK